MKYHQTSKILVSISSVATEMLLKNAQWPTHSSLSYVKNIVESLTLGDRDASDYDCLIIKDDVTIVRDLRTMGITLPILSLIAGTSASARIEAIQFGADDCLGPVFSIKELIVRTESLCRRNGRHAPNQKVRENSLSVIANTQVAKLDGKSVALTATEVLILRFFLENQDRLISADQVGRHVWGEESGVSANLVCVHMANLRRKMRSLPWRNPIRTIRGGGYVLPPD
jgi:DNA-binding response OmpR family regulator